MVDEKSDPFYGKACYKTQVGIYIFRHWSFCTGGDLIYIYREREFTQRGTTEWPLLWKALYKLRNTKQSKAITHHSTLHWCIAGDTGSLFHFHPLVGLDTSGIDRRNPKDWSLHAAEERVKVKWFISADIIIQRIRLHKSRAMCEKQS